MLKPTVGRVVLYRPMDHEIHVRHAATVAYVNNDGTVNLSVVNCFGVQYSVQGVMLIADAEKVPVEGQAEWMAYQHAQVSIKPDLSASSFLSAPTELGLPPLAVDDDVVTSDDLIDAPITGAVEDDLDSIGPMEDASEPESEPVSILTKTRKRNN